MHTLSLHSLAVARPAQIREHRETETGLDIRMDGSAWHRGDGTQLEHSGENIPAKAGCIPKKPKETEEKQMIDFNVF